MTFIRQNGTILLPLLIWVVAVASVLLLNALNAADLGAASHEQTARVLAQAKEALISYAVTYGDTHEGEVHGYLPCPDQLNGNSEGSAEANCGQKNISQLGRLPWKTLDLSPLLDGDGECLWYAVSGTYKNNPKADLMNWDTDGKFQVFASNGINRLDTPENQTVAVIIAPGAAREGQDRSGLKSATCGTNYTSAAFLDNDIEHGINNTDALTGKFIQGSKTGLVNDRIAFITRLDIWNAIQKRHDFAGTTRDLTQRLAECLADYGNHNLLATNLSMPWPAEVLPAFPDFGNNEKYNDKQNLWRGRIPYSVGTASNLSHNLNIKANEILITDNGLRCPHYSANPDDVWSRLYPWWDNWKDHFYYALSPAYQPGSTATHGCGPCLQVNGSGNYAAIVLFAGSPLTSVSRASTDFTRSQRGNIADYLELENAQSFAQPVGMNNFSSTAHSDRFNDTLFCIAETGGKLGVQPCPVQ